MHWRNSQVQVLYFLVGKTHTPDEAFRVLKELREERQMALNNVKVSELRTRAKTAEANSILNLSMDEAECLNAEADLAEIEVQRENVEACVAEAKREIVFIDELLIRIEPHRLYKDLPEHEAHQLTQRAEWKFELMTRAENYIATQGTIPADHFATMRLHPDWESIIAPRIADLAKAHTHQGDFQLSALETPMRPLMVEVAKDLKLLN